MACAWGQFGKSWPFCQWFCRPLLLEGVPTTRYNCRSELIANVGVNGRTGADFMQNLRIPLRVVFYRQEGRWLAHCLEFDLCGDGESRESALACLWEAIGYQLEESVEHNNPANLFTPADGKFFQMFAAGRDIAIAHLHVKKVENVELGKPETREYSNDDLVCA